MTRLGPLILALAILSPGVARAQPKPDPQPAANWFIDGLLTVPEYALAKLTLVGGTSTTTQWLVQPEVSEHPCGQMIIFTGPPGTYSVVAFAVANNKPILCKAVLTIKGTGPKPPPIPPDPGPTPPPPDPGPTPTPKPVGNVWAMSIYDTSGQVNLPPGQLAIYGSSTIQDSVKTAGAWWRRYELGDTIPTKNKDGSMTNGPLAQTKWGGAGIKAGLPALVIIDSTGTVLSATPLPATEADVVAAVKGVTGK